MALNVALTGHNIAISISFSASRLPLQEVKLVAADLNQAAKLLAKDLLARGGINK
jgi:hypothetical protein